METSEKALAKFDSIPPIDLLGYEIEQKRQFCNRALINIVYCCFELKDWVGALLALNRQKGLINFGSKTRGVRIFFHNMSRCFYELGHYEESIKAGESSILLNRSYEGVYWPIALSYKALGNLDHAIWVMRRALRYETPWDEVNKGKVQSLLQELMNEKDASAISFTNNAS